MLVLSRKNKEAVMVGGSDGFERMLKVTVLDVERAGPVPALASPATAALAIANSKRRGYLAGTELASTFAWLRPNEMIWNNWVNSYLLGKKPPSFDLLYWNADSMNMPAAAHRDLVRFGWG